MIMEENEQQIAGQPQPVQQPDVTTEQPQPVESATASPAQAMEYLQPQQPTEQPQEAPPAEAPQQYEQPQEVQPAEQQPQYAEQPQEPQPTEQPVYEQPQEALPAETQSVQGTEQPAEAPQQYEQPQEVQPTEQQPQYAEQPQEAQPVYEQSQEQPVYEQPQEVPQPAEPQPVYEQQPEAQAYPQQPTEPQQYEQPQESAEDFPPLVYEIQEPVSPKPKPKLRKTGAKPVIAPLINNPEGTVKKTGQRTRRRSGVRFTPPSGALPIIRSAADITDGTEDGIPTAEESAVAGSRRVTKSRVALFIDIDGTNISRDNLEELFYTVTARQQILFAKIYGYGEDKAEFDDIIQKYNVQVAGKLDSKSMYGNRIDPRVLLDAYECASKNKSVLDTVFVWCAPCELSYMFERIIKLGVATATIDNPYFDCNNQWTSTKIKLFSPYSPIYDPNYAYGYDQQQYDYDYTQQQAQQPEYYEQPAQGESPAPAPEPVPAPVPQPAAEPPASIPEPTPAFTPTPEPEPAFAPMPEPIPEPVSIQSAPVTEQEELTPEQMAEQMPWLLPETPAEQAAGMEQTPPQPQPNKEDDFEPEPEGVEIHENYGFGSEADRDTKPPETEEDNRMMVIDMMKEMGMDFGQGGGNEQAMAGMMGEDSNGGGNLDDI
jgi:hypothetical protein